MFIRITQHSVSNCGQPGDASENSQAVREEAGHPLLCALLLLEKLQSSCHFCHAECKFGYDIPGSKINTAMLKGILQYDGDDAYGRVG